MLDTAKLSVRLRRIVVVRCSSVKFDSLFSDRSDIDAPANIKEVEKIIKENFPKIHSSKPE